MPATSRKQQRFMGMVHATQKGEISAPSAEVAEVAKDIDPSSAEEFASTSHKGLPEKKAFWGSEPDSAREALLNLMAEQQSKAVTDAAGAGGGLVGGLGGAAAGATGGIMGANRLAKLPRLAGHLKGDRAGALRLLLGTLGGAFGTSGGIMAGSELGKLTRPPPIKLSEAQTQLEKESAEDEGNPKKRKGNFRKEMLEGAPMVGTMMGMPIGGAAGSVLGLGGAAAGLGLASKSKVLRDLANRHPQLASGLLAAGMLGAAPAGMVGGGLLGHYLGRQATKLGSVDKEAFWSSAPDPTRQALLDLMGERHTKAVTDAAGFGGGIAGGVGGGVAGMLGGHGFARRMIRHPTFAPRLMGKAQALKELLSMLGGGLGAIVGSGAGSSLGRLAQTSRNYVQPRAKTSESQDHLEKESIEPEEAIGSGLGGIGGGFAGGHGAMYAAQHGVPKLFDYVRKTVPIDYSHMSDADAYADYAKELGSLWARPPRSEVFAHTADNLAATLRHLGNFGKPGAGTRLAKSLSSPKGSVLSLLGLIGAGGLAGAGLGMGVGGGLGRGASELRKMLSKPAAQVAKQSAKQDVLKLAAALPPIMRKAISTVGRPKAAMVGLLSLLGPGGLSKRSHAKRASVVVQPQTKEAAIKTATAHLRNMQTFFEKTATLADLPTVDNFANYLDCVVRLNPQLGVLTKVSTQLRMHKPVPAAFRDAYPAMDKTSRAKVASRLVMTYLETRRQVSDTINELEHPHV